jgi:hypothetical protein
MWEIGLFTAIVLRWPTILPDLLEHPNLLNKLSEEASKPKNERQPGDDYTLAEWLRQDDLISALYPYSDDGRQAPLLGSDLRPLMAVQPNLYQGAVPPAVLGTPS